MDKTTLMCKWFILKHCNPSICDDQAAAFNAQLKLKSEIRNYYKEEAGKDPVTLIENANYDSFTELIKFPEYITTEEEAEFYFRNNYYKEYFPSQYDCTGQLFTTWYKIVKRSAGYVVFHHVCMDV